MTKEVRPIPPEGGWGYMVAAALIIAVIIMFGPILVYGVIYGDFFESLGGKTSNIILTMSIFSINRSLAGLFANYVFQRYTCRQVGVCAGALLAIGSFLTIFIYSIPYFIFVFSILQGLGCGFMLPAILTSFNQYFAKKRFKIFIATKPFVALSTIFYPILIHGLREQYGFRGMLAVLAAINMHGILVGIIMRPVRGTVVEDMLQIGSSTNEKLELKHLKSEHLENNVDDVIQPILNGCESRSIKSGANNSNSKLDETKQSKNVSDTNTTKTKTNNWSLIEKFFDLSLFTDWRYVNILVGMCFAEFSCHTFQMLLPIHLRRLGWTNADISICLSGGGLADLASTIVLTIGAPFYSGNSRLLYLVGLFATIAARGAFLFVSGYTATFIVLVFVWFFRTWTLSTFTLIYADYCGSQRFPAAFGMYSFIYGIFSLIVGYITGAIRDATGSYTMCFGFLTFSLLICAIPWTIEMTCYKVKKVKVDLEKN